MRGIVSPCLPGIILADNSCLRVIARVLFCPQKYAGLDDKAYGHLLLMCSFQMKAHYLGTQYVEGQ